jgi:hypothetical protein
MWSSSVPPPPVKPPQMATGIVGQKSAALDLSIGLNFLADVLAAMGAVVPNLAFAYKHATKIQFKFDNVQSISVDPLALGNHLAAGNVAVSNPFYKRYFVDEDTDAYVITEVLKSNSISVSTQSDDTAGVSLDVPAIKAAVGLKVAVSQTASATSELTYSGQEYLTFGHKIFELAFINGSWAIKGKKPSGDLAFALGEQEGEFSEADAPIVLERAGRI